MGFRGRDLAPGESAAAYLLDWESDGWLARQVASTDTTDRSGVDYDDSAWPEAAAPFNGTPGTPYVGPNETHPLPVGVTEWPVNTHLWLRRVIDPGASQALLVTVRIDNFCEVFWNGVSVAAGGTQNWFTTVSALIPAGSVLETGNVLAVRARDDDDVTAADQTYLDVRVESYATDGETWDEYAGSLTGLVHWWDWGEDSGPNVADRVGSLPLTLSGGYTRGVAGLHGKATRFGAGVKAVSAGLGDVPLTAGPRCFIVGFRTPSGTAKQTLFSYGTASTRRWFAGTMNAGGSTLPTLATPAYADDLVWGGMPAPDGEWHLAAFGYNGQQESYAYLDGMILARRLGGALNTTAETPFTVGQSTLAAGADPFLGDIDEMLVLARWPGKSVLDRLYRLYLP